jgi:hypothetical protein
MLEQDYLININNSFSGSVLDLENRLELLKNVNTLFINESILFSLWNPSYSSLGL